MNGLLILLLLLFWGLCIGVGFYQNGYDDGIRAARGSGCASPASSPEPEE